MNEKIDLNDIVHKNNEGYKVVADFAVALMDAECIDHQFETYLVAIGRLGFDGAAYSYIPKFALETQVNVAPVFLISPSYPVDFLEHYGSKRMDKDDFTIKSIVAGHTEPMDWWLVENKGLLSKAERGVINIARQEYRILNGLSIPTQSDMHAIAGASLISMEADRIYRLISVENRRFATWITQMFHGAVRGQRNFMPRFLGRYLDVFTEKETLVARQLIARGTFSGVPGMSDRNSYAAFDRLRKKLSGPNAVRQLSSEQILYLLGTLGTSI